VVIAAKFGGGSMLNLLSGECADLLRIGALHQGSGKRLCLWEVSVKREHPMDLP
jgi:hypothetical protein